jgi:IMP dehydrogenase
VVAKAFLEILVLNMADFDKVQIDPADLVDGYTAEDLFHSADCLGITFDDLITLPGMIDFGVHEVDLTTNITRNHKLNAPLCSSPMDTVTEESMAIAMALNGGIGFIHTHCSIEEQAAMVRKVKTYENGFIMQPAVLSPDDKISKLDELRNTRRISGVPLTVDGKLGSRLVGLISNRDTDFVVDRDQPIRDFMTPLEGLITGTYPISIAEANDILKVP